MNMVEMVNKYLVPAQQRIQYQIDYWDYTQLEGQKGFLFFPLVNDIETKRVLIQAIEKWLDGQGIKHYQIRRQNPILEFRVFLIPNGFEVGLYMGEEI